MQSVPGNRGGEHVEGQNVRGVPNSQDTALLGPEGRRRESGHLVNRRLQGEQTIADYELPNDPRDDAGEFLRDDFEKEFCKRIDAMIEG
jgi:hypothetical protein